MDVFLCPEYIIAVVQRLPARWIPTWRWTLNLSVSRRAETAQVYYTFRDIAIFTDLIGYRLKVFVCSDNMDTMHIFICTDNIYDQTKVSVANRCNHKLSLSVHILSHDLTRKCSVMPLINSYKSQSKNLNLLFRNCVSYWMHV